VGDTNDVNRLWRTLALATGLLAGAATLSACSSNLSLSAQVGVAHWPKSGPGRCGTTVPSSYPLPGTFLGLRGVAKADVPGNEVFKSIPSDGFVLWCMGRGTVSTHLHPVILGVFFVPQASSADIRAAREYFNGTGLFSSLVDCTPGLRCQ
jgi:hypothetical protein